MMFGFRLKKKLINYLIQKYNPAVISYSQAGEDSILNFLFRDVKISRPKYLDIGANLPDIGNNTYKFYLKGSQGVLVEADATLLPEIRKKRPKDIILNYGISDKNNEYLDFYIFDVNGLNTFNKDEAFLREKTGICKITKVVKVQMKSINEIIGKYFDTFPDLLSLDIEGMDLQVLKSLDYNRYPIPVICVETCQYSENNIRPKNNHIFEYLGSKGYTVYADTYINSIFVLDNWFKEKSKT
jgi:FkbM family methyltransferase